MGRIVKSPRMAESYMDLRRPAQVEVFITDIN